MKERLWKILQPTGGFPLRKSSDSDADKFALAEVSRRENRAFTGAERGLRIAQVLLPKLKASFNFVRTKREKSS